MSFNEKSFEQFTKSYLDRISQHLEHVKEWDLKKLLIEALKLKGTDNKIIFLGNGGSALNASHYAMGFSYISKEWDEPIQSISLPGDFSHLSSLSNDYSFEDALLKQTQVFLKDNDIVVYLSASGNSKNLIKSAEFAKSKSIKSFAFLGGDGGALKDLVDTAYCVPTDVKEKPGMTEDIHMIAGHILTQFLESKDD